MRSNITLTWDYNGLYCDIYKSNKEMNIKRLPEPYVSGISANTYTDYDVIDGKYYYYIICTYDETGVYRMTKQFKILCGDKYNFESINKLIWLDETSLTLNGTTVTKWADKSGNNNDFVADVGTVTFNESTGVFFNTGTNGLKNTNRGLLKEKSYIWNAIVFKANATGVTFFQVHDGSSTTYFPKYVNQIENNCISTFVTNTTFDSNNFKLVGDTNVIDGNYHIYFSYIDLIANKAYIYLDGKLESCVNYYMTTSSKTNNINTAQDNVLGRYLTSTAVTHYQKMFVLGDTKLSQSDIDKINLYIGNKYDIKLKNDLYDDYEDVILNKVKNLKITQDRNITWETDYVDKEFKIVKNISDINKDNYEDSTIVVDVNSSKTFIDTDNKPINYYNVSTVDNIEVNKLSTKKYVNISKIDEEYTNRHVIIKPEKSFYLSDYSINNKIINNTNKYKVVKNKFNDVMAFSGINSSSYNSTNSRLSSSISALGTSDFTLEIWMMPDYSYDNYIPYNRMVQIGPNSTGDNTALGGLFLVRSDNSNSDIILFDIVELNYTRLYTSTEQVFKSSYWSHFCVQRKDGVFYIYKDGKLLGYNDKHLTYNISRTDLYIGANNIGAEYSYMFVDSFRITKQCRYDVNGFDLPTEDFAEDTTKDTMYNNVDVLIKSKNGVIKDFSKNNRTINQVTINKYIKNNSSVYLNATGHISVPINTLGTSDFTLEGYFNLPSTQIDWARLFQINNNAIQGGLWLFVKANTLKLQAQGYLSSNRSYFDLGKYSTLDLNINEWNHICMMRRNGIFYIYINGVLQSTSSINKTYSIEGNTLFIGSNSNNNTGEAFKGNFGGARLSYKVCYDIEGFEPPKRFPIYDQPKFKYTTAYYNKESSHVKLVWNCIGNENAKYTIYRSLTKFTKDNLPEPLDTNIIGDFYIDDGSTKTVEYYYMIKYDDGIFVEYSDLFKYVSENLLVHLPLLHDFETNEGSASNKFKHNGIVDNHNYALYISHNTASYIYSDFSLDTNSNFKISFELLRLTSYGVSYPDIITFSENWVANDFSLSLGGDYGNSLKDKFIVGQSNYYTKESSKTIVNNVYYNVIFERKDGYINLYLNGEIVINYLQSETTGALNLFNVYNYIRLGYAKVNNTNGQFHGYIRNFKIYDLSS